MLCQNTATLSDLKHLAKLPAVLAMLAALHIAFFFKQNQGMRSFRAES